MPTPPKHLPHLQRRAAYSNQKYYRKYREEIREDCQRRCVYCDVHELEAGGVECMTLDHLRPKKHYPHLEHNPTNLVWACNPCNQLKGNDWPAVGHDDITVIAQAGYLDVFEVDRQEYFSLEDDGSFRALQVPAEYIIASLALNRPFLRYIRRRRDLIYVSLLALEEHFREEITNFNAIIEDESLNPLDKMRWMQDRDRFEAFLELVLAFDEVFDLP